MKFPKLGKKSGNSKAVVGNAKSKKKKNKLKLGYFALLAVLLLSAVGYTGWGYVKTKQLKAEAENWTSNYISSIGTINACRNYIPSSMFGPLWKVRIQTIRNNKSVRTVVANFDGNYAEGSSWLFGVVNGLDVYASALRTPVLKVYVYHGGGWQTTVIHRSIDQINSC